MSPGQLERSGLHGRPTGLHRSRPALASPAAAGRSPHRPPPFSPAGFSLLELSVALFVVSVLAALAVPGYKRIQIHARSGAVIKDLRVFAGAFQNHANVRGDWPEESAAPGEIPPGMQPYLSATAWTHRAPIGGAYTWAANSLQQGERYRAILVISSLGANQVTAERRQLVDIDRRIDDGDLSSGSFRLGYRNQPFFVIEH